MLTKFAIQMELVLDATDVEDAMKRAGKYMIESADNPDAPRPEGHGSMSIDIAKVEA